ncbi:MAG: T9SS type A sorting domain-containing protein [Fluviicola sp.]|nr:T9SS type A sorting domain-containing protein [Fluviicola sp.]
MRILLLIAVTGLFPISFFAQRNVDLELTMTSPSDGEYIPPGQIFPFTVSVKNVGTTNLLTTDSVAYYLLMNGDTLTFQPDNINHIFYTGNALQTGESFSINRQMGFDVSLDGQDVDLCVFVKPYSLLDPVSDSLLTDNTDCVTIHVMNDPASLDEEQAASVSIYPNPAASQFKIDIKDAQLQSVNAIDAQGRSIKLVTNANKFIDCSTLANGMYQLEITTSNGIALKKLVINNP